MYVSECVEHVPGTLLNSVGDLELIIMVGCVDATISFPEETTCPRSPLPIPEHGRASILTHALWVIDSSALIFTIASSVK